MTKILKGAHKLEFKDKHLKQNHSYWSQRSGSYSDVNKEELSGESRNMWKAVLSKSIAGNFPDSRPSDLRILDVGTGPGFFAIILTELGYKVTAIDMTKDMLREARVNAGDLASAIDFLEMDAQALGFSNDSFDVVVSRNLTWNLPDPELAYSEWHRVLKPGGLMLNFDSNWYRYLFDESARDRFEEDRLKSAELGLGDQNVGENFDEMEDIARKMPLSAVSRPAWDISVLEKFGLEVSVNEDIWKEVWTRQEQTNFASTPMFLVSALKKR